MRRERPLNRAVYETSPQQKQRYWNEFDDGDEVSDNDTYTIPIDPHSSSIFPGALAASRIINVMRSSALRFQSRILGEESTSKEQQPLLGNERPTSGSSNGSSDLESGEPRKTIQARKTSRSRLAPWSSFAPSQNHSRDALLSWVSVASFVLSFVLLFLVLILVTTGRRKAAATVDVGVLIGAVFSLALGFGGLLGVAMRTKRASIVWWFVTSLLFAVIVIGNIILLIQAL